jgi:hypothetical protein
MFRSDDVILVAREGRPAGFFLPWDAPELPADVRRESRRSVRLSVLPVDWQPPAVYEPEREEAERRLAGRDREDWPTVSLALARSLPIWSQDKGFEVAGVTLYTTGQLLAAIRSAASEPALSPSLERANLLYVVVSQFAEIDQHLDAVSNLELGYLYEELVRRGAAALAAFLTATPDQFGGNSAEPQSPWSYDQRPIASDVGVRIC